MSGERDRVPPRGRPSPAAAKPSGGGGVYWPRPVAVEAGEDGTPLSIGPVAVEAIREEWLVEDRWWTPEPLRRRYFELVLADGRNLVVYCEPFPNGRWFEQRA